MMSSYEECGPSNHQRVPAAIAGAVAAFTVDVLVYPLDTIKTRYQSQDYLSAYGSSKQNAFALRGLYQGIGSVVLATLPAAGLFFSTYEQSKAVIGKSLPIHESLAHSSASAIAELASCLVLAPAEVIKQNAQMLRGDSGSPKGKTTTRGGSTSLQAFRHLAGKDTSRRLFTGYTALVARNLPFTALQFPIFEQLRSWAWKKKLGGRQDQTRGIVETGLIAGGSAGSAGAVAAFVTTPSDVVKTRMMLMAGSTHSGRETGMTHNKTNLGSWSVARTVYRERGPGGFFRGGLFRSGWTAIGSSLYLGTYDAAKVWMKRRKKAPAEDAGIL
ncbi:hypothetical protein EsDP_00002724 [Epichloe bromicola]|uniref:Mitochondrial carrier protein n=1 Tax=Epichloe bromicola TaxID=79588 RepID=A0ABQ0CM48_9HYPO